MTGDLRRISVVLFEGFELLDVFGPAELFSLVPDQLAIEFIGPGAGPVASSQGGQVTATIGYDAAPTPTSCSSLVTEVPGLVSVTTARWPGLAPVVSHTRRWAAPAPAMVADG